MGMHISEKHSL